MSRLAALWPALMLASSRLWRGRERRRRLVLHRVASWSGVDAEWRREFVARAIAAPPRDVGDHELVFEIDGTESPSPSVMVFRRARWRQGIARLSVDRAAVRRLWMIPATRLVSSSRGALPPRRCAPAEND